MSRHVTHVRPSVRMEQLSSHSMDFHDTSYLALALKICLENPNLMKIGQKYRTLYMKTKVNLYPAEYVLDSEKFQMEAVEKIKTRTSPPQKSYPMSEHNMTQRK